MLARRVYGRASSTTMTVGGRHVDDAAASLGKHHTQFMLGRRQHQRRRPGLRKQVAVPIVTSHRSKAEFKFLGVEALAGTINEPAWKTKPSWYPVVTADKMIPATAQLHFPTRWFDGRRGCRKSRDLRVAAECRGRDHQERGREHHWSGDELYLPQRSHPAVDNQIRADHIGRFG